MSGTIRPAGRVHQGLAIGAAIKDRRGDQIKPGSRVEKVILSGQEKERFDLRQSAIFMHIRVSEISVFAQFFLYYGAVLSLKTPCFVGEVSRLVRETHVPRPFLFVTSLRN